MPRIRCSKYFSIITGLCILILSIYQNAAPVFAEVQPLTETVNFPESIYQSNTYTTEIKGIFDISDISVNTGKVTYEITGDKIKITVSDGEHSRIGPHTKDVTVTEKNTFNIFPESVPYNSDGYSGELAKTGSGYDSENDIYWATYYGIVTNPECKFYKYKVDFTYTLNAAPQLSLTSPSDIIYIRDKVDIKGIVKDENIGDQLNIYYSFDNYSDSTKGVTYKTKLTADGTEQRIDGTISISALKLEDGVHTLYMWAVDRRGEKSYPAVTKVMVDTVPPQAPVLAQEPTTPTNKSVEVTVTYPDDAEIKEVRIDGGSWVPFDSVANDEKIIMYENGTVEARCSDAAGNVSDVSRLVVSNIDRTGPDTPILVPDITEPTNKTVTVTVYYAEDSVVKEIRIGESDWSLYEGSVTVDRNAKIEARSMDEAGNISPIGRLIIENIDAILPTAPVITVSAEKTKAEPITAVITPGTDNESGVDRTEFCLEGATTSDWQEYLDGKIIEIKNIGTTTIYARTIDKAGNVSPVTSKSVVIDRDNNGGGNSGGNSGGNNGGSSGGNSVGSSGGNNSGGNNGNTGGSNSGNSGSSNGGNGSGSSKVTEPKENVPSVTAVDLSVFISSDKSKYAEGDIITFTIDYKNKSNVLATDITIKAEIPEYTSAVDTSGGTVNGTEIEWKIAELTANTSGKIEYRVSVNKLDKAEVSSSNTATISSPKLTNTEDDSSKTIFLLYSNVDNFHAKYITGYADNTFRPSNNITRAEMAAIIYNVLDIEKVETANKNYTDVKSTHWAYKCINAVTNAGMFVGYNDGSFRPDNYITRAEFATVLANYLGFKNVEHDKINFSDISKHWARNFIEEIYRVKLIEGYIENGERLFKPDSYISRSEAVTIVNKMLFRGPLAGIEMPFKDVGQNHWAYGHILESSVDHHFRRDEDNSEIAIAKE